jgi:hypothetical protein
MNDENRDYIRIEDMYGHQEDYTVEALFDINENSYALLRSGAKSHSAKNSK